MSSKFEVRRSKIHGSGVFAAKNIKKGEFIIEYKGLLRSHEEVDAAYDGEDETGHTFLFTLNEDFVIDANIKGNEARWINHSCDPNCELFYWWDEEDKGVPEDRLWLQTIRQIAPGEQLLIDYGWPADASIPCRCGSDVCRGWIVDPAERHLLPDPPALDG